MGTYRAFCVSQCILPENLAANLLEIDLFVIGVVFLLIPMTFKLILIFVNQLVMQNTLS